MRQDLKKLIQKYNALSPRVRASLWFTICVFFQKGISVLTTPIFTRLLSEAEYGNYSVFNSWLDIVTIFVSLRLSAGVFLQGLVKFSDERGEFISSFQGLTSALVLAWTIIYILFHGFWNSLFSLTTVQMLAMLVMIWASAVFSFWAVTQRVDAKYRALMVMTVVTSIAKPGIGILFVLHAQDKVTARILGLALVELVCYSCLFCNQMRQGRKFYSAKFWKYAIMFNLPLIPHYLSSAVLSSADRIMIKQMVGAREAGIYSLSYQISQIMLLFSNALEQSINPWMYERIKQKRIEETRKVVYAALTLMAGITILIMFFAPEVLAIFAPAEYQEAVWVIPPVMISVFFTFSYLVFSTYEFYFEKTRYIAAATMSGAVLNIILNSICIKAFGYIAAGYTTLLCYILFAVFHYIFMRKICKEQMGVQQPYNTWIILAICGTLLGAGAIVLLTYRMALLRYAILITIVFTMIGLRKKIFLFASHIIEARRTVK